MGKLRNRAEPGFRVLHSQPERVRSSFRGQPGRETHHFCPHGGKSAEKRGRISAGPEGAGSDHRPQPQVVLGKLGPLLPPRGGHPGWDPGVGGCFRQRSSRCLHGSSCPLSLLCRQPAHGHADTRTHARGHTLTPIACLRVCFQSCGSVGCTHCRTLSRTLRIPVPWMQPLALYLPPPGPLGSLVSSREVGLSLNRGVC